MNIMKDILEYLVEKKSTEYFIIFYLHSFYILTTNKLYDPRIKRKSLLRSLTFSS